MQGIAVCQVLLQVVRERATIGSMRRVVVGVVVVLTGAAVLAILLALKRSDPPVQPVPDQVSDPPDDAPIAEVADVPDDPLEPAPQVERNLTLVSDGSGTTAASLDEQRVADARALAEHHADLIDNVRTYLRDELEKMPRQPLFVIARERGVPTRETIVMSREELIDAINRLDSTAHAG